MIKSRTRLLLITAALAALSNPVEAREECTSACHIYRAWAVAKLCPNEVVLTANGKLVTQKYNSPVLRRRELVYVRSLPDPCSLNCKIDEEGTACQFIDFRDK